MEAPMKPRNGAVIALLLLATCSEETQSPVSADVESARIALGKLPASEVATWQKLGSSSTPEGRYLQASAFDETRKVFVMFGGMIYDTNSNTGAPSQETWEWSPTTGKWTNRTVTGAAPEARSGAAMVYDSGRAKIVLFGGRAGSSSNFEDTWEWDPTTGVWSDVTAAGAHPSARAQHGMVYEKSTKKILLFGGGRSDGSYSDGTGMSYSFGDTWELDPTTQTWTALKPAATPSVRHDFGMVWDSTRNVAVLFAGLQIDIQGASGVPKRDTWEWNPTTANWSERTAAGTKPSQRYAHAMAYDGSRGKVVVFGGWDMNSYSGSSLNDVWDWDPTTGAWTQRLTGSEGNMPTPRKYASMVSNDSGGRIELVAGYSDYPSYVTGGTGGSTYYPGTGYYGTNGSNEVWELDPKAATFTDRSVPLDIPSARTSHAMAYNPTTGKVYVFGGYDAMGSTLDDLWEWDGKTWAQVTADLRPPARSDAALAYDPVRKSLILFGGTSYYGQSVYGDTWEWNSTSRAWTQLFPTTSPDALSGHGMVTDTVRNKILLFGGMGSNYWFGPGYGIPYKDPIRNEVWEWDGNTVTWKDRTPVVSSSTPTPRQYPIMAFDEGRQKLFLFDGPNYMTGYPTSLSAFWEWDPISAGWAQRDSGDSLDYGYSIYVAYDSIRRREVLLTDAYDSATSNNETWEIDAKGPTYYVRALANTPSSRSGAAMAFDSGRGVVVLFGGSSTQYVNETWEYKVSGWGNGEGCTAAFATSCSSGNCVDGVCCESASCTGPCKSCNVSGSEGKCVLAKAGTEVAGSCSNGQACDGSGNCTSGNGQACTSATTCASGFCVDGVCCNSACSGTCTSCNLTGQAGKCSPYVAGTDPQNECGKGTGACKSTCDGVGSCAYPQSAVSCGSCMTCDGYGTCSMYDPYCYYKGGAGGGYGGYPYGTGGSPYGYGGSPYGYGGLPRPPLDGGFPYPTGGSRPPYDGGYPSASGGSAGTPISAGGAIYPSGGTIANRGGTIGGGGTIGSGGGTIVGSGGTPFGYGGTITSRGGSIGPSAGGTSGGFGGSNIDGSGGGSGYGGGKLDGGSPKGGSIGNSPDAQGSDALADARLHRSGCSCELGRPSQTGSLGSLGNLASTAPFFLVGAALLRRRTQRKRR
jgi:hypothetical protein